MAIHPDFLKSSHSVLNLDIHWSCRPKFRTPPKKVKIVDKKLKQLITRTKSHLIKLNSEKVKKVILYGSYARGEATKDSDIDVLVVVGDSFDPSEVRRSLSDIIFDILIEKEELISIIAVPESFFDYGAGFTITPVETEFAVVAAKRFV